MAGRGAGLVLVACAGGANPEPTAPDVLVVLLDDVGVDAVSGYGLAPDPPLTPTLDRLADEGTRFTRAYGYSVCTPSRAALLTGRYGRRNGIGNNLRWPDSPDQLPRTEPTFARTAREAGYATAMFGKWHVVGERANPTAHPHDLGFDHFDGMLGNFGNTVEGWGGRFDYTRWERVVDGAPSLETDYATSVLVDATIDWVAEQDGPWLAYLALPSAHGPLHLPPAELPHRQVDSYSSQAERFTAMVEAADRELGRLLDTIDATDTIVFVAGDNGTNGRWDADDWDPLGAKGSTYEGGIRVPLVVWGPAVRHPGATHDGLVHLVDVAPTIADLVAGGPEELDGSSLLPALQDPTSAGRTILFAESFYPLGPGPYRHDWRIAITPDLKVVEALHLGETRILGVGPDPADEVQLDADALAPGSAAHVEGLRRAAEGFFDGLDPR